MRTAILFWVTLALVLAPAPAGAQAPAEKQRIEAGFRLLYEMKFTEARAQFASRQKDHPDDPLGHAAEAASYLFEEFAMQGVLTSEFFLDDKKLLGGIEGQPDEGRRKGFLAANSRALELARKHLRSSPKDPGALFVLTISTGMLADYTSLIEKRHFQTLGYVRDAESYAKNLLAAKPDAYDAYLALGAANYIIGCLPMHKRFFLWFAGVTGNRERGMNQLQMAAGHGHYLRPFAKMLLALVSLREKQPERARTLLEELTAEFPTNPLFHRELALLKKPAGGIPTNP